jgi:predicted extracellular nuclease
MGRSFVSRSRILHALGLLAGVVLLLGVSPATADTSAQTLPFAQNWENTGLITTNDDWSGVPGVVGYLGQDITTSTGVDPQTLLTESAAANDVDVIANQTSTAITNGGVAEFQIANPVVALQGSGTADAPYLLFSVDTTGLSDIAVAYNLRDVDGTADNAVQPVALQYRVGGSGAFTNLPAGYVADATTGPSIATLVTPISVTLPAAASNHPLVQVRVITTNAVGSDEWVGVDDISITGLVVEAAPSVQSTSPPNNAAGVALGANVSLTFSEPVNVTGSWFSISCATSGSHAATVSGGPTAYTLDPDSDFASGESCTVTVLAANVTDQDANDPPDNMASDFVFSFTAAACGQPFTPIPSIQGSGLATPLEGQSVTTEGVVVGDYEGAIPTLRGFYIQDAAGDADPATSDGIFVFNGNSDSVSLGDVVRVTGTAQEFQDQTQIGNIGSVAVCSTGSVAPSDVTFPAPDANYLERYEGMLVRLPQTMYVTEHFQLGRFGQVLMSSGGHLQQPTNVVAPGAPALAMQAANDLNKIIVDDALQNQNPDPILFGRGGTPLSAVNTLRGSDTVTGLVGVMTYTWAGNAASGNAYRLRPINALGGGSPSFQPSNPRPAAAPSVGGNVHVGAMNLLNYFNTFGASACTNGVGGDVTECRGAENSAEFDRQWPKTVAAITGLNSDVLGVMEIENDGYGPTSALQDLVDKLNAATAPGTYAFVDADAATGQVNALGADAIKVGLIYQPARVTPVGQTAVLNSVAFVNGGDQAARNRPSLAQAFQLVGNGERFIIDVNHLKSKGSACDAPDAGDGQANCNVVRVNAANELTAWLANDPTGTGDSDVLIVGDLNSYAKEDPITAIQNAGYTNLVQSFLGPDAYSYLFDGQFGYLDHALGSSSLTSQVSGVGEWHINADEPSVLDYNTNFKSAAQIVGLYAPDRFRMSDHDPVLVGLTLNGSPSVDAGGPYSVAEGGSVNVAATGSDPNGDTLTYAWDLDDNGSFETPGQSVVFSAAAIDGPATRTIQVRATDPGGLSSVSSASVTIQNVAPTATFNAPTSAFAGFAFTLSLTSPIDPAPADTFTYAFDCGTGYGAFGGSSSASCTPTDTGTLTVRGTISDDDGGTNEYVATVDVTVTFDSLCALTREYSSSEKVADQLCKWLDKAAEDSERGKPKPAQRHLAKYVKSVEAEAGRAFSPEEAAILVGLAQSL